MNAWQVLCLIALALAVVWIASEIIFTTYFKKKSQHTRSIFNAASNQENSSDDDRILPPAHSRSTDADRRKDRS